MPDHVDLICLITSTLFAWSLIPRYISADLRDDLCKNSSLKLFIAWAHYASKILYWNYLLSMSLQSCPCDFNSCLRFLFNSFHINNFTCVATYYCDFNYWIPIKIIVLLLQIHLKFYINDSLKNEQFTNSRTWTVSWEGNYITGSVMFNVMLI